MNLLRVGRLTVNTRSDFGADPDHDADLGIFLRIFPLWDGANSNNFQDQLLWRRFAVYKCFFLSFACFRPNSFVIAHI